MRFPVALRQTQLWLYGASAIRPKFDQSDSMLKTDIHTHTHTTLIPVLHSFAFVDLQHVSQPHFVILTLFFCVWFPNID